MTLKLERDLNILKMYLHTENKVASLRHAKLLKLYDQLMLAIAGEMVKNTKITLNVKGQGQISPTSNHF